MNRGKFYLAIISHARPDNVEKMEGLVGPATWYVGKGEASTYLEAGASKVIESGPLCRSRNAALDDGHALGLPVVELSDDLRKLQQASASSSGKNVAEPISFNDAVDSMLSAARETGAKLVGVAPTANPFFFRPETPVKTSAFIVGDFILVLPNDLRFDERMKLKEDYDYTLEHLARFGVVARVDSILATFLHRTNPGGACVIRDDRHEQEAIDFLDCKWPGRITRRKSKPNEVFLKLPKA